MFQGLRRLSFFFFVLPFISLGKLVEDLFLRSQYPVKIKIATIHGLVEFEYGTAGAYAWKYDDMGYLEEHILASAVRHPSGLIFSVKGGRHNHCIAAMSFKGMSGIANTRDQGFLTSCGRYVDRKEALVIARAAGQLLAPAEVDEYLFPEDIWKDTQLAWS